MQPTETCTTKPISFGIEINIDRKRWRWISHVLWKGNEDVTKIALRWTPGGRRKRNLAQISRIRDSDLGITWKEI